jgi:hypothetical protein
MLISWGKFSFVRLCFISLIIAGQIFVLAL